jgi:hypothetical protein
MTSRAKSLRSRTLFPCRRPQALHNLAMDAETTLPVQATKLPQPSLAVSDPYAYLAQRKFHQSLRCPRTHKRFTYADVGDVAGPPVLVFLPSFCSRWLAVMVDGLANEVGVRLIAMDRCGSGGTESCALNDRVDVTCGSWPTAPRSI